MHRITLEKLKVLSSKVHKLTNDKNADEDTCECIIAAVEKIEFFIISNQNDFKSTDLTDRLISECKLIVFNLELHLSELAEEKFKRECINKTAV